MLVGTTYKCYLFSNNSVTFTDARDICQSFLANLVEFETSIEFDAVMAQMVLEYFEWYWIGYYASFCDGAGTFTWNYLINSQLANMNLIAPWYPGTPLTFCWVHLLLRKDSYIYNWPDHPSYLKRYVCEMG